MPDDLRPCPFCGTTPEKISDYQGNYNAPVDYTVHCDECFFSLDGRHTPEEAAALWNRRAAISINPEDAGLLERMYQAYVAEVMSMQPIDMVSRTTKDMAMQAMRAVLKALSDAC